MTKIGQNNTHVIIKLVLLRNYCNSHALLLYVHNTNQGTLSEHAQLQKKENTQTFIDV